MNRSLSIVLACAALVSCGGRAGADPARDLPTTVDRANPTGTVAEFIFDEAPT